MHGAMIKAFGEPKEVLELIDVQEPAAPAAGEVLVGVEYAPVNMNDLYVIQGAFPVRPSLPSFVGNEGVGRVLTVGSGVEHLKVGDRVLIPLYAFSWRERLVVPAAGLFSLPEADPKQLAMLGINPPWRLSSSTKRQISNAATGSFKTRPIRASAGRSSPSPKLAV
jgi:NADPH:quinone reductase-like Zn-dependent oxidoreductase